MPKKSANRRYRVTLEEEELLMKHRFPTIELESMPQWLAEMQDGKNEVDEHINVYGNTAVLCDIHLGFHDIEAIRTCIQYLQREKIDSIVLNGDTIDAHRLSRWAQRKDDIEFTTELQLARNFMDNLKATFPKAKLYFKVGNHEDRLERYIQEKANEFAGLVSWQSLLKLDEKGIQFVDSNQLMLCNGTWIAHGHELKISSGQNPANTILNKTYANTCIGHLHKTHTITRKTLEGNFIRCDVIGTLSKLKRGYMPYSHSNHGFAIIEEDGTMQNLRIDDGKVN